MDKIKIGFMVTGSSHFEMKWPLKNREASGKYLRTLDATVIDAGEVITNVELLAPAVSKFKKEDIDLLIVQAGSFTWDNIAAYIAQHLREVPLVLWAVREPVSTGGGLEVNSMCSIMMNGATCGKLGKEFTFVYGNPDEACVREPIERTVRAVAAVKTLRRTRVGLIGSRPTGFYGSTFSELGIRRTLGIEMEPIALSTLLDAWSEASDEEVAADMKKVQKLGCKKGETSDKGLADASRLYLAVRKCMKDASVSAIALQCWPELLARSLLPCLTNSRLGDEGVPVACEGDVHGLISQLMQTTLTGEPTFFCDMVDTDEAKNTVAMWHCGACPTKLAPSAASATLKTMPARKKEWQLTCPIVEFQLKPGRVTVCRFCELGGRYRLFIASGEAVRVREGLGGNGVGIRLDANVRKTVEFIVANHVEHHFSLAYGDLTDDLVEMCRLTGIEPLIVGR